MAKQERIFTYLEAYAKLGVGIRSSRHGAAVVYKNRIVGLGRNSYKTHPIMIEWGRNKDSVYLHAEMAAIVNALGNVDPQLFKKCDFYIIRVNKKNERAQSCPCSGCKRALDFFNFKNIYYT